MKDTTNASTNSTGSQNDSNDPWESVRQEVHERFELLPDNIKKIMMSDEYEKSLFDIAKSQKLTYEELGILEVETSMVLLGMNAPEDYRDELQLQLKKNDAEIDALVAVMNDKVFTPIRSSLEKIYAAKKEPEDYLSPIPASVTAENSASATQGNSASPATTATPSPLASKPTSTTSTESESSSLTNDERTLLAQSGVELTENQSSAPIVASSMPGRTDMMRDIENPPKSAPSGILANKFSGIPAVAPSKTTDYSIPKTPAAPAPSEAPIKNDPYREPVE